MNNRELYEYSKTMSEVKLLLWDELPNFAIYSDQLLQIVSDELYFLQTNGEKIITKSMVNNYVKWKIMPKPLKKKYEKIHIVYVTVITMLKQILPISIIKEGIQLQVALQGDAKTAYNSFCGAFEESVSKVFGPILESRESYVLEERNIEYDKLGITSITTALSYKLLTEKIIETSAQKKFIGSEGDRYE